MDEGRALACAHLRAHRTTFRGYLFVVSRAKEALPSEKGFISPALLLFAGQQSMWFHVAQVP
jgi:hypothetical protein